MKNLNTLFLAASSLFLLVGCGPKNEEKKQITANEFNQKLTKIKKHEYKQATVDAREKIVGTGDFETNKNEHRIEVYKYYSDTGAWLSDESVALLRRYIFNFDSLTSLKSWVELSNFTYTYTFYSDLSFIAKENGTFTDHFDDYTRNIHLDSEMHVTLNEYGYITLLEANYVQDITEVYSDVTKEGTKTGETNVSITFK